jgi:hypothetical protein
LVELTDGLASRLADVTRPRLEVRLEGNDRDGEVFRLLSQQTELITEAFAALRAGGGNGTPASDARVAQLSEELARLAKQVARNNVRHVNAQLSASSATNFFKPLDGSDEAFYIEGGLFIATYDKAPPLGQFNPNYNLATGQLRGGTFLTGVHDTNGRRFWLGGNIRF